MGPIACPLVTVFINVAVCMASVPNVCSWYPSFCKSPTTITVPSTTRIAMLNSTWFQNLTLVNTLSIDNNVVSMIAPHTFDGLRRIQKISLKGNRITSIPAFTFNNFSSLTNISLSSNAITSIALGNFNGVPHLLQISIDNNPSLTWLPPGLFASAPSLTTIVTSPTLTCMPLPNSLPNNTLLPCAVHTTTPTRNTTNLLPTRQRTASTMERHTVSQAVRIRPTLIRTPVRSPTSKVMKTTMAISNGTLADNPSSSVLNTLSANLYLILLSIFLVTVISALAALAYQCLRPKPKPTAYPRVEPFFHKSVPIQPAFPLRPKAHKSQRAPDCMRSAQPSATRERASVPLSGHERSSAVPVGPTDVGPDGQRRTTTKNRPKQFQHRPARTAHDLVSDSE